MLPMQAYSVTPLADLASAAASITAADVGAWDGGELVVMLPDAIPVHNPRPADLGPAAAFADACAAAAAVGAWTRKRAVRHAARCTLGALMPPV
jgi:hypothetical protein